MSYSGGWLDGSLGSSRGGGFGRLWWGCWLICRPETAGRLAVIAVIERAQHQPQPGLIALTCSEIQHLFTTLITQPTRQRANTLAW